MSNLKNEISKNTLVRKKANSLNLMYGKYSVKINGIYFETDLSGELRTSDTGDHFQPWNDTGITCENKKQFVEAVFNKISQ